MLVFVSRPVVLQNDFSILNRRIEENGLPRRRRHGYNAGFFAYNSLAGGVLTGKYLKEPPVWERARPSQQTGAPSGDAVSRSFRRFDDVTGGGHCTGTAADRPTQRRENTPHSRHRRPPLRILERLGGARIAAVQARRQWRGRQWRW